MQGGKLMAADMDIRSQFAPMDLDAILEQISSLVDGNQWLNEAERLVRQVLAADPRNQRAHMLGGVVYGRLGRWALAAKHSASAFLLSGKKDEAAASNLMAALRSIGVTEGNLAVMRDVVAAQPDNLTALLVLIGAKRDICEWGDLAGLVFRLAELVHRAKTLSISPFTALSIPGLDAALHREIAFKHGQFYCEVHNVRQDSYLPGYRVAGRRDGERLRIGYFSSDFHDHPVGQLVVGVLEHHDRSLFEIHAFSFSKGDKGGDSPVRRRIKAAVDAFHDLSGSTSAEIVSALEGAEIDILVDLSGWTHQKRFELPTLRLAPVMANWLGYPGTMGLPALADYIIGDPVVTPIDDASYYSETIAALPRCYLPFDRYCEVGPRPSRAAAGLPEHGFVFSSFNGAYKLTEELFGIWCRLLAAVPASYLWLPDPGPLARANLLAEAGKRGIGHERFIFAERMPTKADHLARLALADLALDTLAYNSHTTGADALWVGVPMVACRGRTFASRVGASLLETVGLPECIADCPEDYFRKAVALARDPDQLARLRERLVAARETSALFDTAGFVRDLERLYRKIWDHHLAGQKEPIMLPRHTDDHG